MRRLTVALARQHLADLLDAAEKGETVVIERRGVRFGLSAQGKVRAVRRRRSLLESVDPLVSSGQWTWEATPKGLELAPRRSKR